MKDYLFYVRKYDISINDYKVYVYRCTTSDPYHVIGEMYYRSLENIEKAIFVECSEAKLKYWAEKGIEIEL